jgi:PKD repeat protein
MKRYLILIFIFHSVFSNAQILCIYCYDQNDSISQNVNNLVMNGGFENHTCSPNTQQYSFCPNSNYYSCDISNWICTGGGIYSYANIWDNSSTIIPQGNFGVYFGNGMCHVCPGIQLDTTCLYSSSCVVGGILPGYPSNEFTGYGGTIGVSLEQTVSGLIPGQIYVLEFWAGGEGDSTTFFFLDNGVFAVNVGFGDIFLKCKPTLPYPVHTGTRYIVEFLAAASSHTIKFTNWGHICLNCTELILDDVRLYTLAELSPSVPICNNLPIAGFSAMNNLCPGTCADFTNMSLNASSYQWSFPGAVPDTSTAINPSGICYANPGSYDIQLIASNANGSDTLLLTNYINIFPFPPLQSITQSGDTLFAIGGSASYQWYINGNLIPGATNYIYVAPSSGDYNVVVTDYTGCEVEAAIFNVVANILPVNCGLLTVFPNPVEKKLTVTGYPLSGTAVVISIYNMLGELVLAASPLSVGEGSGGEAAVSKLPPGLYYLEITSGEKIFRTKFIKQ